MSTQDTGESGRPSSGGGRLSVARRGILAAGSVAGRTGGTVVKGFWSGFRYPLKGARFVYLEHPRLARIWIWPILITITIFITLVTLVGTFHDDLLGLVWRDPEGGVAVAFHAIARVLLLALLFVIAMLLLGPISSVLAAVWNGMLAEEVERIRKGLESPPFTMRGFLRDLGMSVRLEVGKLLVYMAVMAPAFMLSMLIPFFGQAVYVVFGALFTASYNAVDYTDWPLARRGKGFQDRLGLVRRHFLPFMGLGTAVWLILLVPLVGLLIVPAAVAGGTLLVLDMEDQGQLDLGEGRPT